MLSLILYAIAVSLCGYAGWIIADNRFKLGFALLMAGVAMSALSTFVR